MNLVKKNPLLIGAIVLFIIGITADPAFLTLLNIQNLLRTSSILGTLAIGVTIVMLIREIDLSCLVSWQAVTLNAVERVRNW